MAQFPADARVAVPPFAQRREGDNVTIGDPARGVFVEIPAEGLEILDALGSGATVGEAALRYEQGHGDKPDLEDFLSALAAVGLIRAGGRHDQEGSLQPGRSPLPTSHVAPSREPDGNPGWTAPALARRLVGVPIVGTLALAAASGIALLILDPRLIPSPDVLVFHRHLAVMSAALFALSLAGVMVHELGHLLAARASGVPARIGIGHRLWILVAQTDMSGIWLAPKRRRYLAFLAGPLIDAASTAILLAVLWSARRGWLALSPSAARFLGAVLWTYLLRLLWECFVFVRTDFYYVLSTALGCKRLLGDTEDMLRNQLARLRSSIRTVDQSGIPPRERRAIRAYSIIWLAGRVLAMTSLVFITLPVFGAYVAGVVRLLSGARTSYGAVDVVVLGAIGIGVPAGGLYLWIRSLYLDVKRRRTT